MTHCKKCGGRVFRTISALRKHQWAEHPEHFEHLRLAATRSKAAVTRRSKALVKLEPSPDGRKPPMLATDLLTQLQSQHRFLSDVVSLISGIITQHEESK